MRFKKAAFRTAFVLVVAYVLVYLIGANLVLNTTSFGSLINRKPEKLLVEWKRAWTILPGRVHVEALRVRGQSRVQQWQFRVPEGTIRIQLLSLIRKRVKITRGVGSGFEFRMRPRLKPGEVIEWADHHPEIEGLTNPPDPAPEDIYPEPKKPAKRRWLIDLSGLDFDGPVEVSLGRLWTVGTGGVDGEMTFQIGGDLEVPKGFFDLNDATVTLDGQTFAQGVDLVLDLRIPPFAPRESKPQDVMSSVLGDIRLENGRLPDLRTLNLLLPVKAGIQATSGEGVLSLRLSRQDQVRGGRGEFKLSVDDARLQLDEEAIAGNLDMHLRLTGSGASLGWYELGQSTLSLQDVVLPHANPEKGKKDDEGESQTWWGRLQIEQGKLVLGRPATVNVVADFQMQNTAPLLNLFVKQPVGDKADEAGEKQSKIPGWVKFVPDIKDVSGRASFDMNENGMLLDDLVVTGDKMDMMARLWNEGEGMQGQLYMRYRLLHIGVEMRDGKKDLKLIRPKRWFLQTARGPTASR